MDIVYNQTIQTDSTVDSIETMIKDEKLTMKFDQTMSKLNNMSDLGESFVPDLNRIKLIETSVGVVDSKVNKCLIQSNKLDETLQKLDELSAKTSLLEPEIDRIKLIEKSAVIAENKLNKCLDESLKLDLTLAKLETLNSRIVSIEPEMSKINSIELSLDKFNSKQDKIISLLLESLKLSGIHSEIAESN